MRVEVHLRSFPYLILIVHDTAALQLHTTMSVGLLRQRAAGCTRRILVKYGFSMGKPSLPRINLSY